MKDTLAFRSGVVRFLGSDRLEYLQLSETEWAGNMRWLDRSGLALPLAARFEALQPGPVIPSSIRAALRSRLVDNQKRMERMLAFFKDAVRALDASRVRHCCVKGFSLVPDCFDSIRERHQVDLDLLIAPQDRGCAQSALLPLGYRVQRSDDSGEIRLVRPWKQHLGAHAYLYGLPEPPPVELHTQVWEGDTVDIALPQLSGFLDASEAHELYGVEFRRLRPAQHCIYLLLHILRHLLGSWTRPLSLYEVAAFIRTHAGEVETWIRVAQIIESDRIFASACALVLALVDCIFPVEMPLPLHQIVRRNLSAESSLWISCYAASCLLSDPPGSKLALLVQQQFWTDREAWRRYLLRRLLPIRKPHHLSEAVERSAGINFAYRAEDAWYRATRFWYHLRSDCEYLGARWRWRSMRRRALEFSGELQLGSK